MTQQQKGFLFLLLPNKGRGHLFIITIVIQSLGREEKGEWTMRYALKGRKDHEK
ncbi:MAG: hypothetical protein ACLQGU_07335 [bacterium]